MYPSALTAQETRSFYVALRLRRPTGLLWNLGFSRRPRKARMACVRMPALLVLGCHLAAIEMQRLVRGHLMRILVSVVTQQKIPRACQRTALARTQFRASRPQKSKREQPTSVTTLPGTLQPKVTDIGLVARYLEAKVCGRIEAVSDDATGFEVWALTRLQAWARMLPWLRYRKTVRMIVFQRAALSIQRGWSVVAARRAARGHITNRDGAAVFRLQRAWLAFTNRRIFAYFRDMVKFREQGDPAELLRCINPREGSLLDPGAAIHIRFRLGGALFPPTVYYKIFTHGPVTDVGAFAPRDYTDHFQPPPITLHNHAKPGQALRDTSHAGWYRRIENNGWRPVAGNVLRDMDSAASAAKPVLWHHSKVVRRQALEEKRRAKKLHWLRTMYAQGREEDTGGKAKNDGTFYPSDDEEVDALLEWSDTLDFDKYVDDWQGLATSSRIPIGSTMAPLGAEAQATT